MIGESWKNGNGREQHRVRIRLAHLGLTQGVLASRIIHPHLTTTKQARPLKSDRKALGTYAVFAILVVAVVAVTGAAAMLYAQPSNGRSSSAVTPTSSSQGTRTSHPGLGTATETTNSSLGLKLTLSVNSTTIPSQDAIGITASVLNTLPRANNLTASYAWAVGGLSSGPCDPGNSTNMLFSPVGLGVFRGTYGLNNISSASSPLFVWALVECIVDGVSVGTQYYPLSSITSYSLLPGSDNGTYAGYYVVSTYGSLAKGVFPTQIVDKAAIYAANGTGFYNSLGSSLPANYTLVAGDEWGQLALLHFSVVASNNLPQVGSFLANGKEGACTENGNPVPCITGEFSQAFNFDCAVQAATVSGCTTQVPSSLGANYTITVWYPLIGHPMEPAGDNCKFSVPGYTLSPYQYCFMVNATAFAMSLSPA